MSKEVKELVRRLRKMGLEVESGRHISVRRNGRCIATLPSTPGDTRSLKNAMARLRQAGVDIR